MEKLLQKSTINLLEKLTCLESLKKANFIFSSIIHGNTNKIILKTEKTPYFAEDWLVYLILRAMAKTWIITGKILRAEDNTGTFFDINFNGHEDVKQFYYREKKNLVVLSNNFGTYDTFRGLRFMNSEKFEKYITGYDGEDRSVHAIEKFKDLGQAKEFCIRTFKNPFPVLFEIGPLTLRENLITYPRNLLDYILITEYYGPLDKEVQGPEFPNDVLSYNYKLIISVRLNHHSLPDSYYLFKTYVNL
jgi:hypothetical protein